MSTVKIRMTPGWQGKLKTEARPHLIRIADEIADDVRENIREEGLIETGDLLRSVSRRRTRVYIGTDHWQFIEYGTVRHTIYARPVLANIKKGFFSARDVRHPGNKAYRIMRDALMTKRRF